MPDSPQVLAAAHVERTLNPGVGHRYVADPHEQITAAGTSIVRFTHEYLGIPVFLESVSVHVTAENEIARTGGSFGDAQWSCGIVPELSSAEAVERVVAHFGARSGSACQVAHRALLGRRRVEPQPITSFPLPSRPTVFRTRGGAISAHMVIVAEDDRPQLGWLVRIPTGLGAEYLNVIAAAGERAGEVLFCAPWSTSARCSAAVFRNFPDATGANRENVVFPDDWMRDASMISNSVETLINNAAKTLKAIATADGFSLTPAQDPFGLDQALVNVFFLCNQLHDFFLLLGFGEKEGNFQLTNRPNVGRAGDRLRVHVFDSVIKDLGMMAARDDGRSADLVLGRSPGIKRLAALDADIVIHEYAHGVSHRIVGGRLGFNSLFQEQSIAVDEGWSDYFAITIQNAFRANPLFTFGAWVSGKAGGLRTAPYSPAYPGKYGDLGKKPYTTPIAAAEVWASALIRMNDEIGAALQSPLRGHEIGWAAVVESMKLLDDGNPTFVHARDALFDAFDSLHAGNVLSTAEQTAAVSAARIAFKSRGLGPNASSKGKALRDARGDTA